MRLCAHHLQSTTLCCAAASSLVRQCAPGLTQNECSSAGRGGSSCCSSDASTGRPSLRRPVGCRVGQIGGGLAYSDCVPKLRQNGLIAKLQPLPGACTLRMAIALPTSHTKHISIPPHATGSFECLTQQSPQLRWPLAAPSAWCCHSRPCSAGHGRPYMLHLCGHQHHRDACIATQYRCMYCVNSGSAKHPC